MGAVEGSGGVTMTDETMFDRWTEWAPPRRAFPFMLRYHKINTHVVECCAVSVAGAEPDGRHLYVQPNCHFTENIGEAEVYLRCSVAWDGCVSWDCEGQIDHQTMGHFCGRKDVRDFTALMLHMCDSAFELVEARDRSLYADD